LTNKLASKKGACSSVAKMYLSRNEISAGSLLHVMTNKLASKKGACSSVAKTHSISASLAWGGHIV
jgi:hypothetical protein